MKNKLKFNTVKQDEDAPVSSLFCSCRLLLAIIGFVLFTLLYCQRIGMSVAIVCMVNHTAIKELHSGDDNSSVSAFVNESKCGRELEEKKLMDGPFIWEKEIQGHILGAFFYGYLVSQIPGGLLAERFGGKWVMFGFFSVATLATLLTPVAARYSFVLLIILRVIMGIGSGVMFPAMHAMWGRWSPPDERSKLAGITCAGAMFGNIVTMPIAGVLCEYGFDEGWGSIFYIFGIITVILLAIWAVFTSNSPSSHRSISQNERDYINMKLEGVVSENKENFCSVPWGKFVTSGPVWALIIANFCTDWGLYTFLTNIPTFYKEVLFFDIKSNGLYSALPFIGFWLTIMICPIFADMLLSKKILSTVVVRKLFNSIGLLGAAVFLIGLSFLNCDQTGLAVALLTLAVTISGCVYSGYFVNHMDIAPKYAGTLLGISNGLSAAAGFIAPYLAAVITKPQTRESWQIVFFIAAGIYTFGAIFYIVFGSGTLQDWARIDDNDEIETKVGNIYKPGENGESAIKMLPQKSSSEVA